MSSTILEPLAQNIADFIDGLDALSNGQAVTGVCWSRRALPKLPAGEVGMPTIERTDPLDRESEIARDDWTLDFPIGLYVELKEEQASQRAAVELVEAFIVAVDIDPTLGSDGLVFDDAAVTESTPEVLVDQPKSLLVYRCRLSVIAHPPTPTP